MESIEDMNNHQVADTAIHEDESTIDSCEISVQHELMKGTQMKLVSNTPKSLVPKPILLRMPCTSSSCNLGVELSLSLPLIAYIHPTSPLLNVLHVGDVILELDGRRSTDLRFEELNGWFAGRRFSSDCIADKDCELRREKCILFLPGRNSPYNPESSRYEPDGLRCHSLLVKLSDLENSSNETECCGDELLYFRLETGTTDEITEESESTVSEVMQEASFAPGVKDCSVLSLNSTTACSVYLDDAGSEALSPDCSEREESVSTNPSGLDERSSVATPTAHTSLERYMTEGTKDAEKKEAPVSPSTTATTFSKSTPDDSSLEGTSSSADCSSLKPSDVQIILKNFIEPNLNSADESPDMGKNEVPVSPSTTATTLSKSTPDDSSLEETSSSGECSSVRSRNVQSIPNDFIAPNLNSPDESSDSINYPSSPLMVFERPSPQSSVSLSEELNELEVIAPSLPFETESCETDEDKKSAVGHHCDLITSTDQSDGSSTAEHFENQKEFDTLCKPVLEKNGIADDTVERKENEETPQSDHELVHCSDIDHPEESENKAAVINNSAPPTLQEQAPPEEEEQDWEKLQQKRRQRPAPAIDTITIDVGCDEDISTIFGGKYNPNLYDVSSRVEDDLIGFVENGKFDPNTMSQLLVHGLGTQAQFQNESNRRKIELERLDHQMKEERLNLLKRRHCIIEGIFAAFIFVAVVVLVGVLVVVLRG